MASPTIVGRGEFLCFRLPLVSSQTKAGSRERAFLLFSLPLFPGISREQGIYHISRRVPFNLSPHVIARQPARFLVSPLPPSTKHNHGQVPRRCRSFGYHSQRFCTRCCASCLRVSVFDFTECLWKRCVMNAARFLSIYPAPLFCLFSLCHLVAASVVSIPTNKHQIEPCFIHGTWHGC